MLMPHEIVVGQGDDQPPIEDTDIDATMTLKDEIEKWRRDNNE